MEFKSRVNVEGQIRRSLSDGCLNQVNENQYSILYGRRVVRKTIDITIPPATTVVNQDSVAKNTCGQCAFYNMLSHGRIKLCEVKDNLSGDSDHEKISGIVERTQSLQSSKIAWRRDYKRIFCDLLFQVIQIFQGMDRVVDIPIPLVPVHCSSYDPESGMRADDLLRFADDVVGAIKGLRLKGGYLDRADDEPLHDHLLRIHRLLMNSINQGVPVIVLLESYAPRFYWLPLTFEWVKGDPLPMSCKWDWEPFRYKWECLVGHYISVVEVGQLSVKKAKGFWFRYLDSSTGKCEEGYASYNEARNFVALKEGKWLNCGRPYLQVTSPSLCLKTDSKAFFLRTFISMTYAIYLPENDEGSEV